MYTQKDQDAALEAMQRGLPISEIAKLVPIPQDTLYGWHSRLNKGEPVPRVSPMDSPDSSEFHCPDCGQTFRSRQSLYGHIRVHRQKTNTAINVSYTTKDKADAITALKKNMPVMEIAKLLPIPSDTLYTWKQRLSRGKTIREDAKPQSRNINAEKIPCPDCGQIFSSEFALSLHSRTHRNSQINTDMVGKQKVLKHVAPQTITPEIIENTVFSLLEKGHKYDALLVERDGLLKENEELHNELHALRKMHEHSLAAKLEQANLGIIIPQ